MTKKPITNVPASIRQKLLNISRESHRTFDELLQYFAMERFLFRLSKSKCVSRFCLKGALMFRVWDAPHSRPTRDIDFRGEIKNETGELVRILRDICNVAVDPDGLAFDNFKIAAEQIIGSSPFRVGDFRLISYRIKHAGEDFEAQVLLVA